MDFWRTTEHIQTVNARDAINRDALVKSFYDGKWMANVFETDTKHGKLIPNYTHCIYVIYNDIDDKIYFGSSLQKADKRFERHVADAQTGNNSQLYNHMRKLGIEHFHPVPVKIIWLPKIKTEYSKFWRTINIAVLENFERDIIIEYKPTGRLLNERTPAQNQSRPPPSMQQHDFLKRACGASACQAQQNIYVRPPTVQPVQSYDAYKCGIQAAIAMLGDREPAVRSVLQGLLDHKTIDA